MLMNAIPHWHSVFNKPGIGVFRVCRRWWTRSNADSVHFRPELDGAGWHCVPWPDDEESVMMRMMKASSPHEAMAILRDGGT